MIVGIGGEPATGKTKLVTTTMDLIGGPWPLMRYQKILWAHRHMEKRVMVLGRYFGHSFGGTDRLSMAVQPLAVELFKLNARVKQPWSILFEGDRLFNGSLLDVVAGMGVPFQFWLLTVSPTTLDQRHTERSDDQGEVFLAGRRTKYERLGARKDVEKVPNDTLPDLTANAERLADLLDISRRRMP